MAACAAQHFLKGGGGVMVTGAAGRGGGGAHFLLMLRRLTAWDGRGTSKPAAACVNGSRGLPMPFSLPCTACPHSGMETDVCCRVMQCMGLCWCCRSGVLPGRHVPAPSPLRGQGAGSTRQGTPRHRFKMGRARVLWCCIVSCTKVRALIWALRRHARFMNPQREGGEGASPAWLPGRCGDRPAQGRSQVGCRPHERWRPSWNSR